MGVRLLLRSDQGSVTAEFAMLLPAVVMVLSLAISSLFLATQSIVLTDAAGEIARLEARGDTAAASERLARLQGDTTVERLRAGSLHCVSLGQQPGGGLLAFVHIAADGCAAVSTG